MEASRSLRVCPGIYVEHQAAGKSSPTRELKPVCHPVVGPALAVWIGHATDKDVRQFGSSGGALTALCLYSLESRGVDFVAHSRMNTAQPWKNKSTLSRNRSELLAAAGSRYAPSSPCDLLPEVERTAGRSTFVGKPCDVAAVRLLTRQKPQLASKLDSVLTFFCAGTPSSGAVRQLAENGVGPAVANVTELHYRGNGWPGSFRMRIGDGSLKDYFSYEDSWGRIQRHRGLRCHLCADGMGELGDVSCGDAWHLYRNDGNPGLSIIVARTLRGKALVEEAERAGYLTLRRTNVEAVLHAQGSEAGIANRRRAIWARLVVFRLFGIPHPRYIGFRLFRAWLGLSLAEKGKSILGTVRRVYTRRLFRPQQLHGKADVGEGAFFRNSEVDERKRGK